MDSNFFGELHPQIVHFPIAIFVVYGALEIIGIIFKKEFLNKSALLLLCIGVGLAFFAAITGNEALTNNLIWNEKSIAAANNHQLFANLTIWFFTGLLLLRAILTIKKKFNGVFKYLFLILIPVGIYFVFKTGSYGGKLIHEHGVGTDLIRQNIDEPD